MKKVSVIVPLFNAEKTIEECIDSLINQTILDDLEIIIVDDCSTDNSRNIVSRYEAKYPDNILFIKLDKNSGPGNARNIALEYATGEYIGFVDSDDAVQPDMFEKTYEEAVKTGSDYVDSGFYDQKNDRAIVFVSDDLSGELDDKKRSDLIVVGGYICTKIFRREFLDAYWIRFRNEYMLEDMDFLIECTARAERISSVKEIMYIYRDNGGSLSKTSEPLKYIHSQSSAMQAIHDRTHALPNYEGIREAVEFTELVLYSNVINVCTNLVYLNIQPREAVISVMMALRKVKDGIIRGGYDSEYIKKGISKVNLNIIRSNDISPEIVLSLMEKDK